MDVAWPRMGMNIAWLMLSFIPLLLYPGHCQEYANISIGCVDPLNAVFPSRLNGIRCKE